jgi:hypothetical protein
MSEALAAFHARHDQLVTFCVHVHNRLYHLRDTLPVNLELVRNAPGVGIVVLDYNSSDGAAAWVRAHFARDLASGKLIFARERDARTFHASKSKNLAHRIAPGRVLANLDADNFIGTTLPFVVQMATASERLVLHLWTGVWQDGTYGRIAVSRELFHDLRGYDETLLPIGHQDTDLILRARKAGADVVAVTGKSFAEASGLRVQAIPNSKADTLRYTGYAMSFETMNKINHWLARFNRRRRGATANPDGWGRGRVEINFELPVELT